MLVNDDRAYHIAAGFPPVVQSGDPQRLTGAPFRITTTLANATALALDLTLRGSWYSDRRVRQAYGIASSADANKMEATLWINAVRFRFSADMSIVTGANKAKLLLAATEPYLSGNIGGTMWYHTVAFDEPLNPYNSLDSDLAVTTGFVALKSAPRAIGGLRCYLGGNALNFVSDAATAMGADYVGDLELYGTLHPGNVGNAHPGATTCGEGDGDSEPDSNAIAAARVSSLEIRRLYPGF